MNIVGCERSLGGGHSKFTMIICLRLGMCAFLNFVQSKGNSIRISGKMCFYGAVRFILSERQHGFIKV